MFRFDGVMGRRPFALALAIRVALFILSVLAFPYLLQGLAALSGCRSVGGACGAVGLIGSMAYKPLVAVAFVFSFAEISVRRARDAGLTGWPGLIVPALIALDYNALVVFGAPWSLGFSMGVLSLGRPVWLLTGLVCAALLGALPPRDPPRHVPFDVAAPSRYLVFLALAAALVACVHGLGSSFGPNGWALAPIALATNATGLLLPTFTLYLALLWAVTAFARRPGFVRAFLILLAAAPFAHWGYAHWNSARERAAEVAAIAAISTTRPTAIPSAFVFESRHATGMQAAWAVPGIERLIAKGSYSPGPVAFTRGERGRVTQEPNRVEVLPPRYLLLKVGRESGFARKGETYTVAGGPYELRLIEDGRDDLVGVWYRALRPVPTNIPLLSATGWFRGTRSASTDDVKAGLERFLTDALGVPRSVAGERAGRSG